MLPANCPQCGRPMAAGFVHADGGLVCWNDADPAESVERSVLLQEPAKARSFRLSHPEPRALPARRCEACALALFHYGPPAR